MKQKTTLALATISLVISNVLDAIFTIKYIKFGPLDETNPIMDWLLQGDGCLFAFFKIFFGSVFIFLLWCNQHRSMTRICLYMLSFSYACLMIWWSYVIFLI